MTKLETIELLYNQLFKLNAEIKTQFVKENYPEAINGLSRKENLVKRLINAKKTAEVNQIEAEQIKQFDLRLKEEEQENSQLYLKLHQELKDSIKLSKKQVKMSSAYEIHTHENTGGICDLTE